MNPVFRSPAISWESSSDVQLRFALKLISREQEREGLPGHADHLRIKGEHHEILHLAATLPKYVLPSTLRLYNPATR